jgi:hypothetical protein
VSTFSASIGQAANAHCAEAFHRLMAAAFFGLFAVVRKTRALSLKIDTANNKLTKADY